MILLRLTSLLSGLKKISSMKSDFSLSSIRISPVANGAISGDPILAGELWRTTPVMMFVIRRPG
jgi:hypothetical protein